MRTDAAALLVLAFGLGLGGPAGAQPLSAIDWLTDSVKAPPTPAGQTVGAVPKADGDAPPPASPATSGEISVRPIGGPSLDGLGTLPATALGLGADLWQHSDVETVTRLIGKARLDRLPALRAWLIRLLQARGNPPDAAAHDGALLIARIDKLLTLGALHQAEALLELTDLDQPQYFRRWFDTELLLGKSTHACEQLAKVPDLDPSVPTRVYCLARTGDWDAAALNLETAVSLKLVTPNQDALLRRYLDQTNAGEDGPLTLPNRITPLTFRLYEAIGEPAPTDVLPRAFSHADLAETNGWKTRLRGAERLVADGVLEPRQLFELYRAHKPSASGGIYDRASLVQDFVTALDARDTVAVGKILPQVWDEMVNADLGSAFARTWGPRLAGLPLDGPAAALGHRIGLLAGIGARRDGGFLDALALGTPSLAAASDTRAGLIQQGYASTALPADLQQMLTEDRAAEAALTALDLFRVGAEGDAEDLVQAIRLLRALGLESLARSASLELMILDPRG